MKRLHGILVFGVAAALGACGDGGGTAEREGAEPDLGAGGNGAGGQATGGSTGGGGAAGGSVGGSTGGATGGTTGGSTGGNTGGGEAPDAMLPDAAPPPHIAEPQGWNYAHDPITDDGELTQYTLPETTTEDGRLTNASVQVFNCKKEEGGLTAMPFGNFTVALCHEVQDTQPDPDGNYLSVRPPEDEADGNDEFAGMMMYRNVSRAHDYFKGTHGVDWLDFPLPAIVNLQFKITPPIPLGDFRPGPNGWYDFPNAAYFPEESWDALAGQLGLPGRDTDSIIFGQAGHDFSYDASVIMHEYTHAVIGTGRLNGRVLDTYGVDDAPRAMNEALADYFAATVADMAVVGEYGIGKLAPNLVRDLSVKRRCPDNLVNEIHADGRIFGAAVWAIRTALGAEKADRIVFDALSQFGQETNFQQAGELLVAATETVDAAQVEAVRAILIDHGVLDCVRAKEWRTFATATSEDQVPYVVEGVQSVGAPGLREVPGFNQWYIDLEPGSTGVELSWYMAVAAGIPGFGGGGGAGQIELATRLGEPVGLEWGRGLTITADQRIAVAPAMMTPGGSFLQSTTLAGGCLPPEGGRLYLAMLNVANDAANIVSMRITKHGPGEMLPEDAVGVTTCEAP